jgi:GT2 family glycosyltransferase/SAM-dependent methyltransferase
MIADRRETGPGATPSAAGAGAALPAGLPPVSVVIPNWNGRRWLPACLGALAAQDVAPHEVIAVDNGSGDDSVEYLRTEHPEVRVLELGSNTGFAHAANVGLAAARSELVVLLNTDVVLAGDWLGRMARAMEAAAAAAAVACKMVSLEDPEVIYDAGDVLRRDGACEQRGRFTRDDPRWDVPGEVFGACAGAALYRRSAVLALGGFDERYFAYLEDVDLALRLRLAGWGCRYEPAVARHAGEGSSHQLSGGANRLMARNTLVLVARCFPARWLPMVAYRQAGWLWHAWREHRLADQLRGLAGALPLLPGALRDRRRLRASATVPIETAVPARPFRGPRAGGYGLTGGAAGPGSPATLAPMAVTTGERVSSAAGGFNPSFQRHRAEYRLSAPLLGPGRVLDLGCGTGHSYRELAPRETVGVDLHAEALEGQERETHAGDMRSLPFPDASFESVISIHSIEHVADPERVMAEVVRVLQPGGRAIFGTPNRLTFARPDEIIDPYHHVEYDAVQLHDLAARYFDSVEVLGVEASPRYRAIHDAERRELDRLLALDPLRLRRLISRRVRQWLYDRRLRHDRDAPRPGALEIGQEDFWLSRERLDQAIDLLAICDRG